MGFLRINFIIALCLIVPFLLGNKSCKRSTTWDKKAVSKWESDHADFDSTTACTDCHDDGRSPTSPPKSHNSHDLSWEKEHGKFSQAKYGFRKKNVCSLCHQDSWCTKCHQQEPPSYHTNFWRMKGHGLMVGLDRSRCIMCHTTDFCERCHSEREPINHTGAWGSPQQLHCMSCHLPLQPTVAQSCGVCHKSTPSHDAAPKPPTAPFHVPGSPCRSCHPPATIGHPDPGAACTACHIVP